MKTHPQCNKPKGLYQESERLKKLSLLRKHFKTKIKVSRDLEQHDFVRFYKKELCKIDDERWSIINNHGGLI